MLLDVNVNYPQDMSILEEKLDNILAKILIRKLSEREVDKLIEVLGHGSSD